MTDTVIVGGGIAGLAAAHDLARAGVPVTVLEASDRVGGLLRRGTVGGIDIDLGAESFATRTDAVPRLIADAELPLTLTAPRAAGAHLVTGDGDDPVRAPLPRRTVLGIPADPLAADVVAILGQDGAQRAAHEVDAPFENEPSLYDLAAGRLRAGVADRLVDTICRSVYSRPAQELFLSRLHPAMWAQFLALGSLTAAAREVAAHAQTGSAVGGIAGGMWQLPEALARAAAAHGAVIRTDTPVTRIDPAEDRFVVHTAAGPIAAREVIVTTDPEAPRVRVVAAAIDHPGLDAFPVGSGVIAGPAVDTAAKALTHVTAKWPWMPNARRHVIRLSARDVDAAGLDTAAEIAREVSRLTGVDIAATDVVEIVSQRWPNGGGAIPGAGLPGIRRAGAAAAGTGLASVIPHARTLVADLLSTLPVTDSSRSPR